MKSYGHAAACIRGAGYGNSGLRRNLLPEDSSGEVDAAWLTKLNLRQRDPIVRRIKRLNDLLFASLGLVLSLPILLLASLATLLDSGFPIFFHQTRTGYLGRPYTLLFAP